MPTKTDPDLSMTAVEVAAIVADARTAADQAARAVDQAEATARGEAPSAGLAMKAANITPAALLELRAAAELAAMGVQAAEKRTEEIRGKQLLAHQAEAADSVRGQAAADLDRADDVIAAIDTFEAALKGVCEAVQAHNERVTHWTREMAVAQIPRADSTDAGPLGSTFRLLADGLLVDGKTFRPLPAGNLLGAVIHHTMQAYPPGFDAHDGRPLADRDWTEGNSATHVDPRARIRRDA